MKTKLPDQIKTVKEAEAFLTDLLINNESYHPEDDANDIDWCTIENENDIPTKAECDQLNKLMDDIYDLPENTYGRKYVDLGFDPCGFILDYLDMQTLEVREVEIEIAEFVKFKQQIKKTLKLKISDALLNFSSHLINGKYMAVTFKASNTDIKKLFINYRA
jgi:hypothetical protein